MQPATFTITPKPVDTALLDSRIRAISATFSGIAGIMTGGKRENQITGIMIIDATTGKPLMVSSSDFTKAQNVINAYVATI
jgi:hypothetical protein